jgi:hypothetical protein
MSNHERDAALEEAALECEEFAQYYSPEIFTPFPEGYVYTEQESRASAIFAHRQLNVMARTIRELKNEQP